MDGYDMKIIRSDRKTVGIRIQPDGQVIIRAPRGLPESELKRILAKRENWIRSHVAEVKKRAESRPMEEPLSKEALQQLADSARKVIPERVAFYAPKVGVTYGRITIRSQRTRWGSCSSKGNLNFNCLLMLTPSEVLDSVVVHELCHRKEMNHSKRFYAQVLRVFPNYWKCYRWLKENGPGLMRRLTG